MAKEKKVELENYEDLLVPIYSTEDNPNYPAGTKVMVHPDMAKHLIQGKFMTDQVPEGYEEPEEEE